MAHLANSDNKETTIISGPARQVIVRVKSEPDGYLRLVVTVDGKDRTHIRHIHPKMLEIEKSPTLMLVLEGG